MERVVAAVRPTDRPGAARVTLARALGIVAALAMGLADRVHGWQVDDVEAECGEVGQHRGDARETRPTTVGTARTRRRTGHARDRRRYRAPGPSRRRAARGRRARGQRRAIRRPSLHRRARDLPTALRQVGLTSGQLAVVLVEPAREWIDPGLDAELPAARSRPAPRPPRSDRCPSARAPPRASGVSPSAGTGRRR